MGKDLLHNELTHHIAHELVGVLLAIFCTQKHTTRDINGVFFYSSNKVLILLLVKT